MFIKAGGRNILAKIAVTSDSRTPASQTLAVGDGWAVSDVVCTAGPQDRPFEEQHSRTSIAIVLSGTFQYRSAAGRSMMTPGSWLLGNPGDCFTCGHEHGIGDRCVSFSYTSDFFESVADDARFTVPRLPPVRALAPLVAKAAALLAGASVTTPEELSLQVAAQAVEFERGSGAIGPGASEASLARVTRVVRMIDNDPDSPHDLSSLARIARLNRWHFLRTFEAITGTTPHQYLLRVRLRRAALRLRSDSERIVDIALGCGFGDVSNFNRTFRAEFGISPREYRLVSQSHA
jgi:AraC-like DNA-binding protein